MLLTLYRRDDGMREMYVSSLLLSLIAVVLPDMICLMPVLWWAAGVQKALNIRVRAAWAIGVLTVLIYLMIVLFYFHDSAVSNYVQTTFERSLNREWCVMVLPLWVLVTTLVICLLGLWSIIGHFLRYNSANVRVQIKILIVLPVWVICVFSVLFPTVRGECLIGLLWLASLYPVGLYIATYGLPQLPSFSHHNPYRRSFSRRSRKK